MVPYRQRRNSGEVDIFWNMFERWFHASLHQSLLDRCWADSNSCRTCIRNQSSRKFLEFYIFWEDDRLYEKKNTNFIAGVHWYSDHNDIATVDTHDVEYIEWNLLKNLKISLNQTSRSAFRPKKSDLRLIWVMLTACTVTLFCDGYLLPQTDTSVMTQMSQS